MDRRRCSRAEPPHALGDVAIELLVEGLADRRHRRQREQPFIVQRGIVGGVRNKHPVQPEARQRAGIGVVLAQIEFFQGEGLGDGRAALKWRAGGAAFKWRALRGQGHEAAAKQQHQKGWNSHEATVSRHTSLVGARVRAEKIAEKRAGCRSTLIKRRLIGLTPT